jgi:hypothetical protein
LKIHHQKEFFAEIKAWADANPEFLEDDDVHGFAAYSQALGCAYHSIRESKGGNEASQRRGVDELIQLAFASKIGSIHEVWYVFSHCN